jgi:hypothetical protein
MLCAGCNTQAYLEPSAAVATGSDAYFVIGVEPANARTTVSAGEIRDGDHYHMLDFGLRFLNRPQDGFILGKARAGDSVLAVTQVQLLSGESDLSFGPSFDGCSSQTLVFPVPQGKVVYLTNLTLTLNGGHTFSQSDTVSLTHKDDFDAARAFLKAHYPALADKVEQGSYRFLPC